MEGTGYTDVQVAVKAVVPTEQRGSLRDDAPSRGRVVVAKFLGATAVAVGRGAHVVDMDIAFLMHIGQQALERLEALAHVLGLLRLGVCLVDDRTTGDMSPASGARPA